MNESIGLPRFRHQGRAGQNLLKTGAAARGAGNLDYDFPITITAMPINAGQRRVALGVVVLLLAIGIATAPLADLPAPRIGAFIPILQTVTCFIDLITAALLFSQYLIRPLHAALALGAGYVCSGLFAFAQTLAYPGGYSATGLIGDGWNTTAWLFVLWQTAFPLAMLTYALSKDRQSTLSHPSRSPKIAIVVTVVGATLATAALIYMVSTFSAFLPTLYGGPIGQTGWAKPANVYLWLLNSAALVVLFFRRRTILDLWLTVTLLAWWPNFSTATFFTMIPFSIGWYILRSSAVVVSSALLLVLLAEMTMIYARLAGSLLLLRRERTDRLASVEAATAAIAHEIRQPLAGIDSLCAAGLRWLNRTPAEIEKAKSCLTSIRGATQHTEEIIVSVRELFKKTPIHRTTLQLNEVSRLVMQLAQHDLLSNGIFVTTDYQQDLPLTYADPMQLQRVIFNLVKNAIDAMCDCSVGERRLYVATGADGHSAVSFYIRDSGPGVVTENRERIFNPFFTTKSNGMGLGLSICRTIIEEHGGTLRLTKSGPAGSTFEIALPIAVPQEQTNDKGAVAASDPRAPPLVPR
jgi:signal transduction histidine kinase